MSKFHAATRTQSRLRLALYGASGTGKTYTSLLIAKNLGARIALIDTEHGSASKYAGSVATFDVCELDRFEPKNYIDALADASGYDVVILDSLSHAWVGKGGLLDQADAKGSSASGGRFGVWRDLTPQQHALVEAILACPAHVIGTMRAKTEYEVVKDDRGKTSVEKLGLAPIQREGIEYEFDVAGLLDQQNTLHITKSRCPALSGDIRKPGADVAQILLAWLSDGAPRPPPTPPAKQPAGPTADVSQRVERALQSIQSAATPAELDLVVRRLAASPPELKAATAQAVASRLAALRGST